jgi:hypothetical protein
MKATVKHYPARYSRAEYTFPTEARIARVEFTDSHMVIHLEDERFLGVPLAWIPTLANATPADREKYFLGDERRTIHWDPDEGSVNEDLRLATYLAGK